MKIQKSNATLRTSLLAVQIIIIALTLGLIVVVIAKRKCKVLNTFLCYTLYSLYAYLYAYKNKSLKISNFKNTMSYETLSKHTSVNSIKHIFNNYY